MLRSTDPVSQRIDRQQLRQVAEVRFRLDNVECKGRDDELGELLINSNLETSAVAAPKRRNGDIGSLWFDFRGHLHRFDLKLGISPVVEETRKPAKRLHIRVLHHTVWLDHHDALLHVKLHLKNRHWQRWAAMEDQGRAFSPSVVLEVPSSRGLEVYGRENTASRCVVVSTSWIHTVS